MKKLTVALALIAALLVGTFAQAGHIRGPQVGQARCEANGSVAYYETFVGGEMGVVAISGDGDTDLDLFVYDSNGRLVAQGVGLTDHETVRFYVPTTGTYRIVVRNLGNVWNQYGMATN